MPIQFKLDYVIEKATNPYESDEQTDKRAALKALAGIELSPSEASAAWPRVLDHKWFLVERLGRDVGLKVAVIDYFENVEPCRSKPKGLKAALLGWQNWLFAQTARS